MLDVARVLADAGQKALVVPRPHPRAGDAPGARDGAARRIPLGRRPVHARRRHRHRGGPAGRAHRLPRGRPAPRGLPRRPPRREPLRPGRRARGPARLRDHRPAERDRAPGPAPPGHDGVGQRHPRADRRPARPRRPARRRRRRHRSSSTSASTGPPSTRPRSRPRSSRPSSAAITTALLGYGARMPKELMLFVKDMVFLDGAMASMAPTVDVLAEIVAVVMYFHEHHGERIAREMGLADGAVPAVDLDGIRASFGITEPVDHLTYRSSRSAGTSSGAGWSSASGGRRVDGRAGSGPRGPPGAVARSSVARRGRSSCGPTGAAASSSWRWPRASVSWSPVAVAEFPTATASARHGVADLDAGDPRLAAVDARRAHGEGPRRARRRS